MNSLIALAAALAMQNPTVVTAADRPVAEANASILVDRDTPIRLMVLNEVSSRTAQTGHRFVLRVDEAVVVDGATIVPAGAKAWGEVVAAQESGAVGKAGRLQARLLHLDHGGQAVPITGEQQATGQRGTTQVALGVLGMGVLGPLALFAPGNNAKLKAGDLFSAYFAQDQLFDRRSGALTPAPDAPTP